MVKVEIGKQKEFKDQPCPDCKNTLWEFCGDGWSCTKCGHLVW